MNKKMQYQTEEQKEIIHFLIVLVVILIIVMCVYIFSKKFVLDDSLFEINYETGVLKDERAIVGTIFNRPEKEYYVIAYDETKGNAVYYSALTTNYAKNEKSLKVYHIDLSNELNSSYYVGSEGKSNKNASKVSEIKLKDLTLLKIKNGKIEKYFENITEIEKELAVTKKES